MYTNLVRIPKKENAYSMKDLRLIALCNVLSKILAKVLANRFKVILLVTISENQSAFVPGRIFIDNMLVAFASHEEEEFWKRMRCGPYIKCYQGIRSCGLELFKT